MNSRIEWVRSSSRLVTEITEEFARTRPLENVTIGAGIHLEPKTAGLLLALAAGRARVVATGNLNSPQQETVDYLRERYIEVIGCPTSDPVVLGANLRQVLAATPLLLLDNG